ncbi:MAG: X2-like carbohydrate binding domain-containing protein, partial [Bacillota bacterium]|nr:X2-like carbohydrate binding domain-containing protein [Bacillota bacterium]
SKDVPLKLTLNGNTLKAIYNGDRKLVSGRDYTYSDAAVTLKGDYVSRLLTDSIGINATLKLKFSAGTDWNVYLTHYSTPVLSPSEGTDAGLNIPVQFNGSRLSTMEAVYSDGSGAAGPQNWTTYKEYGYAFTVDYSGNKVTMTDKFFKETHDGEMILIFHFQSGEVMQYKIVKNGTTVKSVN